ncbi:MAG: Glucosylglycerate phosphorylase [Verrucomicrobiae bacterium]|nr:Glucosylglycerate phosphorylase [Verrucomicrobiae bacterium]
MNNRAAIPEHLRCLYGPAAGATTWDKLASLLDRPRRPAGPGLTERDNLLITYGDQVTTPGAVPLQTLAEFLDQHTADLLTGVHLLPHFPFSSDDGFSVIDYRRVDPALGTWPDVQRLGERRRLMLDAVINHISAQSAWFQAYRRGEAPFTAYFVEADPDADLSAVVRPRALPLLTPVATTRGLRHVWTTFSADQIDLNFRNPAVLLEILNILLFYVANGAQFLRLDAIAYLWKEIGTNCIHRPQTHRIVQLIRAVLDEVAPGVRLITETNVPHTDNIAYFGDGTNEAHLVYNFPLPPLTLHAFRTGNATQLTRWAAGLTWPTPHVTYFNFLASHDGIGLNPARGLLPETEIEALLPGHLVSYKNNPDGTRSPYELNANYLDAIGGHPAAFLGAQAIMLALRGVPGIYFHSLFGSRGWPAGATATGHNRTVNRQKFTRAELERELADPASERYRIFQGYRALLRARAASPAFDPAAPQRIVDAGPAVFAVERTAVTGRHQVLCLHNLAGTLQPIRVATAGRDLLTGQPATAAPLQPYEVRWLAE